MLLIIKYLCVSIGQILTNFIIRHKSAFSGKLEKRENISKKIEKKLLKKNKIIYNVTVPVRPGPLDDAPKPVDEPILNDLP